MGEVPLPPEEPGSLGAGLLFLSQLCRAVNWDGKVSCQHTVTVQFRDPLVSGLCEGAQAEGALAPGETQGA